LQLRRAVAFFGDRLLILGFHLNLRWRRSQV
jgi:hypothetical protein